MRLPEQLRLYAAVQAICRHDPDRVPKDPTRRQVSQRIDNQRVEDRNYTFVDFQDFQHYRPENVENVDNPYREQKVRGAEIRLTLLCTIDILDILDPIVLKMFIIHETEK